MGDEPEAVCESAADNANTVSRPTKSAAKPAEKPSIIFVRTLTRKQGFNVTLHKPAVVLDTNVVLDWLVFRNPDGQALFRAIETGQLRWLVTPPMRDELLHVLRRGVAAAWSPDVSLITQSWHLLAEEVASPLPMGVAGQLRCTDPDDQKFIDLAVAQARWLVSRDRAVLKLARRAERLGVQVLVPGKWALA